MLIFLDLETTGLDDEDRICSMGFLLDNGEDVTTYESYIKSPRKIRTEAMMIHHITNEMMANAPTFDNAQIVDELQKYNNSDNILIAHNINFDLGMLAKEDFLWQGGVIDTLKCSRHLIEEIDLFSLQYLRYELQLYQQEMALAQKLNIDLKAHNALSDALHVKLLYEYLKAFVDDNTLMLLSTRPALIKKFVFGKHKGAYIEEVVMKDRSYLEWLLKQEIDEDLSYSINYYL